MNRKRNDTFTFLDAAYAKTHFVTLWRRIKRMIYKVTKVSFLERIECAQENRIRGHAVVFDQLCSWYKYLYE